MLLQEPGSSQYDLRFRVGDIPVRVHPMFWLVSLALGAQWEQPKIVFIWVLAAFISVLIHELGHALAARWYGNRPSIVLYGSGGLATYVPYRETFASRLLVIFAGPGAGFLFAAVLVTVLMLFHMEFFLPVVENFFELPAGTRTLGYYPSFLVDFILYICVWWGLVNLLPIYPLDGGQIARMFFLRRDPILGGSQAMILSLWTACGATLYFAVQYRDSLFLPLFFGFLAYENYQAMPSQQRWR